MKNINHVTQRPFFGRNRILAERRDWAVVFHPERCCPARIPGIGLSR